MDWAFLTDPMESEKMLSGKMQFADFDINNVIKHGAQLLGSEGREYDFEEEGEARSTWLQFPLPRSACWYGPCVSVEDIEIFDSMTFHRHEHGSGEQMRAYKL